MIKKGIFAVACGLLCLVSCKPESSERLDLASGSDISDSLLKTLPYDTIQLNDMSSFRPVASNWKIVGDVFARREERHHLETREGTGILVNLPGEEKGENIFTQMEHVDLELELDVLMPKGSNSGIYFQGRYEVQLFDSWGKTDVRHSDMGGIYQRWDESRPEEQRGFDGVAPRGNASKAPGLWQHYHIIFQAPRFDEQGNKIRNARFVKVELNGQVLHENVEATGPTRAAAFTDEKKEGPLMFQGDHGPVAFKNIRYKTYTGDRVTLSNIQLDEYNSQDSIPPWSSIKPRRSEAVDSVSYTLASTAGRYLLHFKGQMEIPRTGEYLFTLNGRGHLKLEIDKNDIALISTDVPNQYLARLQLDAGSHSFSLAFNQPRGGYVRGLTWYVESKGIQRAALHAPSSLYVDLPEYPIVLDVNDRARLQRCFFQHGDEKLTHVIAVGTPRQHHFIFNLQSGNIVSAWQGQFLDVSSMWHNRGKDQLGIPAGGSIIQLANMPLVVSDSVKLDQYVLDENGLPVFTYSLQKGGSLICAVAPEPEISRGLNRTLVMEGSEKPVKIRLASGTLIEKMPDGSYAIDDKSYYVQFPDSLTGAVTIDHGEHQDLWVELTPEASHLESIVIW